MGDRWVVPCLRRAGDIISLERDCPFEEVDETGKERSEASVARGP